MEIWKIYKVYCPTCEEVIEWCDTKKEAEHAAKSHKLYDHGVFSFTLATK